MAVPFLALGCFFLRFSTLQNIHSFTCAHTHILHTYGRLAYAFAPIELKVAQESIIKTTKCYRDIKKARKCTHRAKVENRSFFSSFEFFRSVVGFFFSSSSLLSINFQWKYTYTRRKRTCEFTKTWLLLVVIILLYVFFG